jgi:acetyl-CoA decarbonylase/synthase complex subunit delta
LRFEGENLHRPVVAIEVFDSVPSKYPDPLLEYYRDVIQSPADIANKCVEEYRAELISMRLEGIHPSKGNKSAEEAAEAVNQVLRSVNVPVIITGHSHFAKANEVMKKVCEVTAG